MRVVTHDGSFHADEVFALAALRRLGDPVEIVRTRDRAAVAAADLRVDVGFRDDPSTGDFDHHQRGFDRARGNGVRFAAFGLIWRAYGVRACAGDADAAVAVDESLVQTVDASDSGQELTAPVLDGVRPISINGIVGGYNARWDETLSDGEERERFMEAIDLAEGILAREIASAAAGGRAARLVHQAIAAAADPRLVELEVNAPWKSVLVPDAPDALYVITPKRAGYGLQAVPRDAGSFVNRRDLPEAWAGLEGDELVAATGVPDAVFCHAKRFLVVARSRAGIGRLATLALADAS